jgi:hypothetical protein
MNHLICAATLAATLVACSKDSVAPKSVSVFYTNLSNHVDTREPGTAIITWLSPGTVGQHHTEATPGGAFTWYAPGFRTDTVGPNEVMCEHFEAPDDRITVEYKIAYPSGAMGTGYAGPAGSTVTWHLESSWGFTGDQVGPAGSDGFGEVVQGC